MKKIFILGLVVLLPFFGGALVGYNMGHPAGNPALASEITGFPSGEPVAFTPGDRDSVGDVTSRSRRNAITEAVAHVSPAVVGVNVIEIRQYRQVSPWSDDPFFRQFWPDRTYSERVQGLGSGFIISADGYIITNDHVVGNAKEITISMTNGEKYPAKLIGTDQVTDIALVKIEGKNFPFLHLGNSTDVIIGEWVIALGNPFGLFDISDKPTVTVGVVSATGVNLHAEEGRVYKNMIQTDAAINSGNSGGPLVNALGEVIGVNSVIFSPNQGNIGLGFAIPINRVKSVMAELKKAGKVEREFWTGVEVQPVDKRIARYFGLSKVEGVIVSDVRAGSPGEAGGFKVGDILLEANGEKIQDESVLIGILNDSRTGDVIRLKGLRDRKPIDLQLRLERRNS
jgi:serine protease Do